MFITTIWRKFEFHIEIGLLLSWVRKKWVRQKFVHLGSNSIRRRLCHNGGMAYLSCSAGHTHFAQTNFHFLTTLITINVTNVNPTTLVPLLLCWNVFELHAADAVIMVIKELKDTLYFNFNDFLWWWTFLLCYWD